LGTVQDFAAATGGSEATIRRDLAALATQGRIRKVRGGAEALQPPNLLTFAPPGTNDREVSHLAQKRAIARRAVSLCAEGDAIIINGGTTTFQMVHALKSTALQVLTNSFAIADHLLRHSPCTVFVPFGTIYRPQSIILSPFENDGTLHFRARRMFMGAQGLSRLGIMEADALTIQSEQRLMRQANELIVLVDASKFEIQSSMILAPLTRANKIITDDRLSKSDQKMIEDAGIELIIVDARRSDEQEAMASTA
jgi:DeoR family ulaG and ulaABCDEF operon transcriptional repressor